MCRTAGVTCEHLGCSPEHHEGLSDKSVSHVHGALRAVLAQAVEDGVLAVNPADVKRSSRVRRAVPERVAQVHQVSEGDYWREGEARAFLQHRRAAGDRLLGLWEVALATGLRKSELAALTWANVDLERVDAQGRPDPELRVRRSTTVVRGKAVTTEGRGKAAGKTAAAQREVPLAPSTVAALRAVRAQQAADRLACPPGAWVDSGHVFTQADGRPVHPTVLGDAWAAAVKASGVRRITLHGTRHFAISMWITAGVPILQVAKQAGHSDAGVTLRVYAHVIREDSERTRAGVEGTLYGAG